VLETYSLGRFLNNVEDAKQQVSHCKDRVGGRDWLNYLPEVCANAAEALYGFRVGPKYYGFQSSAFVDRQAGELERALEWAPVRAAVSGDGQHGFTAGFMTMRLADGKEVPLKYLSYWEKRVEGWRVRVYKRGQAKSLPSLTPMSNVLPARIVTGSSDAATIERYRQSLAEAETSFSRDAQTLGMRAAFTQYGSPTRSTSVVPTCRRSSSATRPSVPASVVNGRRQAVLCRGARRPPSLPAAATSASRLGISCPTRRARTASRKRAGRSSPSGGATAPLPRGDISLSRVASTVEAVNGAVVSCLALFPQRIPWS